MHFWGNLAYLSKIPLPCSDFFVFLTPPPASPAHFLPVFLMVCRTDVTYSAVLYNASFYMYMCMHMCVYTFFRHIYMYPGMLCVSVILLLLLIITSLPQATYAWCGRQFVNLSTSLSTVSVHIMLPLTLSQASEGTSSFEGCNAVGLVRWNAQGRTKIHSDWC